MNAYTTPEHLAAAELAIEKAGGVQLMAEKITRLTGQEYPPANVRKWLKTGVPARYALWAEYISGIPVERLRPDMSPRASIRPVA